MILKIISCDKCGSKNNRYFYNVSSMYSRYCVVKITMCLQPESFLLLSLNSYTSNTLTWNFEIVFLGDTLFFLIPWYRKKNFRIFDLKLLSPLVYFLGEPSSNETNPKGCAYMLGFGSLHEITQWWADDCNSLHNFICKKPGIAKSLIRF